MKFVALAAILALSTSVGGNSAHAKPVLFPGSQSIAISPDRGAAIINEDRDHDPAHLLYISEKKPQKKSLIMSYSRHVDVLWSPDSKFIIINNYIGSDNSDCILINRFSMKKLSMKYVITNGKNAPLRGNDDGHLYVTCDSWNDGRSFNILVRGYNGRNSNVTNKIFVFDAYSKQLRNAE